MKLIMENWKKYLEEQAKLPNVHQGEEGRMHRSNVARLIMDANVLIDLFDDTTDLPEWVETKITKASDYIHSVVKYLSAELAREQGLLQERGFAPPMPGEKLNRRTKNQTGPQGAANALEHDWSKLGRQARIEIEEGLIGKSGRSGVRIVVVGASEQDLEELKSMVSKITAEQDLESDVELSKEGENHVFSLMQKVDLNLGGD